MDIDAFCAARRDQWDRLDELVRARRLAGSQVDELVTLYRSAARDLSRIRSSLPDPQLIAEMSQRVAAGRARLTGTREARTSDLRRYLLQDVPASLYRMRWWTVGVMVVFIAIAVITAVWTATHPEALAALGTPSQREMYANSNFEAYYTRYEAPDFAAQVWTNNARIVTICVVAGVTGLVPLYLLWDNAVLLGGSAAIMAEHDQLRLFLSLIAPHGLLELTCVFIAGGAGLHLFWTLLVPGARTRAQALAQEGRAMLNVAVALTGTLAVAGLLEAFVTPAAVPWLLKGAAGALALAALWVYTLLVGGRAVRVGHTGDLSQEEAGDYLPVAG